jgi:adenylylsulfate kinase
LPIDEPVAADWVVEFEPERGVAALADELMDQLMEKKSV